MLRRLRAYLRRRRHGPIVRPWGLVAPVLVLLLCLPLLRPLRHPGQPSADEQLLLLTVRSLVERDTLELDPAATVDSPSVIRVEDRLYSAEPPVYAVLLSRAARVMRWFGVTLGQDQSLSHYLLTLLGVTVPVTLAAALVYRMGRLFELKRHWRALLAVATVFGSGLVSYAVVLNPHAPAACLLLGAVGALIHVESAKKPRRSAGWIVAAGASASLAATLDPAAGVIGSLLLFVIVVTRFSLRFRVGGVLLYVLGAVPPVLLHAGWNVPLTGDLLPGFMHPELAAHPLGFGSAPMGPIDYEAEDDLLGRPFRNRVSASVGKLMVALVGEHGIFSHFPVVLIGVLGVFAVMHRHWPMPVKVMAAATLAGGIVILIAVSYRRTDWDGAMFANRFFVAFLPLLLFWAGAWTRRPHTTFGWVAAGVLLAVSIAVALVGTTDPYPAEGFRRYTAREALNRLIQRPEQGPQQLAGPL